MGAHHYFHNFTAKKIMTPLNSITMKRFAFFALAVLFFGMCSAQDPYVREFDYDNSGNRIIRTLTIPPRAMSKGGEASENAGNKDVEPQFEDKIGEFTLIAYPNPTTGHLTVSIENYEKLTQGKLSLYSASGQLLQEFPMDSPTTTIDISPYSSGTYVLTLRMNNRMKDWKIIKE
jgi:hypothetical protein